jgi:uncharacterized membrane protein
MKTLFFIAALVGAVYLIMQTPAGQAWSTHGEPEVNLQQVKAVVSQVSQAVEQKMLTMTQNMAQDQQQQIRQLAVQVAQLEAKIETQISTGIPALPETKVVAESASIKAEIFSPLAQPQESSLGQHRLQITHGAPDNKVKINRQAMLQDIALRMENSSLQALVN